MLKSRGGIGPEALTGKVVYIEGKQRVVGYDHERGKGDHKHIRATEMPYAFVDVPTLLSDFMQDVEEV